MYRGKAEAKLGCQNVNNTDSQTRKEAFGDGRTPHSEPFTAWKQKQPAPTKGSSM